MDTKLLGLSVGLKDGNTFRAIANRAGIVDRGNDLTMSGAFAKDLKDRGPYRPLLWGHQPSEIIGMVTLAEGSRGLEVVEGVLNEEVQRGREALSLLKMSPGPFDQGGSGLSIGYETVRESFEGKIRKLHEVRVYEVSLVMLPMNQGSLVSDVDKHALDALAATFRRMRAEFEGPTIGPDEIAAIFRG